MVKFKSLKPKIQKNQKTITKILKNSRRGHIKKEINSKEKKTRKKSVHCTYIKNPSINHFNSDSHFIYNIDEAEIFLSTVKNKNLIKVNPKELACLNSLIEDIELSRESDKNTVFITINKNVFETIKIYSTRKLLEDPLTNFIKNKFEDKDCRNFLSCRKLASLFYQETGKKTNRTTVNNIIKKRLGYRYLKTKAKTNKINTDKNRIISFAFIKIIVKCLIFGIKLIYVDESILTNKNNNFRFFRKHDEQIYFNFKNFSKLNLIMAIDDINIIHFEINKENTNQDIFLQFMKNLLREIKLKNIKKYAIIMDNLSSHKTEELLKFYSENKINVIFNSPYLSQWNAIELAFRAIKRKYYEKLFSDGDEFRNYVMSIINSEDLTKTLNLNFLETLKEYRKFIIENENVNLNAFETDSNDIYSTNK